MEFSELVKIVGNEPVFETGMLLAGDDNPADIRRQLSRWKEAGKIYQLRRGLYTLASPFQKVNPHPFLVANRMVPASYVSLQSALAYYGMIPEHVPVTTCITTILRRHVTLRLQHHDRASLFAGKLHAIFQRRYVKGRDLYDLMWYLSDPGWPNPNLVLLKNALNQTGWERPYPDENNWRYILIEYLENVDWKRIVADVRPFLEKANENDLLTRENFEKLLGRSLG